MDMTLEERIAANNSDRRNNSRRGGGRDGGGIRKNTSRAPRGRSQRASYNEGRADRLDNGSSWSHDKWEPADDDEQMADDYPEDSYGRLNDDRGSGSWRGRGASSHARPSRRDRGFKVLISNLHPEVGESDLKTVFSQPGGLRTAKIIWERDRSTGNAFAIYETYEQAHEAVRDFNTQLAKGQQIFVKHDDAYNVPKRPLESRITYPGRSPSPPRHRSSVAKPPPPHIDRYVPGEDSGRASSRDRPRPAFRRNDRSDRGNRRERPAPRPRKTKEELDAEMDEYFAKTGENGTAEAATETTAPVQTNDEDVDMDL